MRRRFLTFALPVAAMLALYSFHGDLHHQGTALVAAIAAMWIAWPSAEEQGALKARELLAVRGMVFLLLRLCAVNIWDAIVVIHREYLYPYCGAEDAARYLKTVGADRGPMVGLLYGIVSVQAYFDHNIFANTSTTYFHHGIPFEGAAVTTDELRRSILNTWFYTHGTRNRHSKKASRNSLLKGTISCTFRMATICTSAPLTTEKPFSFSAAPTPAPSKLLLKTERIPCRISR